MAESTADAGTDSMPVATAATTADAEADSMADETPHKGDEGADTMASAGAEADAAMPAEDDAMATDEAVASDETMATDEAAMPADVPAWQTIALTNAVTGEQFTVADFAGKTIFVEPFATWCSNCRRQLGTVDSLRAQSDDDTVFLALSVEANIGDEALANYAAQTGYGLIFAAMTPELLQLLVEEYGQTISNPPATPHFVIGPDGTSSELFTGFRSSADIQALFAAVGG